MKFYGSSSNYCDNMLNIVWNNKVYLIITIILNVDDSWVIIVINLCAKLFNQFDNWSVKF